MKRRNVSMRSVKVVANELEKTRRSGIEEVPFQISYSLGLPGESAETLEATHRLWHIIKQRYRHLVTQTAANPDSTEKPNEYQRRLEDFLKDIDPALHLSPCLAWLEFKFII